jgi:hypothetical protein
VYRKADQFAMNFSGKIQNERINVAFVTEGNRRYVHQFAEEGCHIEKYEPMVEEIYNEFVMAINQGEYVRVHRKGRAATLKTNPFDRVLIQTEERQPIPSVLQKSRLLERYA